MLVPVFEDRSKKDIKRLKRRGKDMRKLQTAIDFLIEGKPLASPYFANIF